ncbi:MAG: DUF1294 domain-containing protein [Roseburia sp.]|nr:DUF1294 domain-containing protein [Roseburia sp.]
MRVYIIILCYLIVMNLVGLCLMGLDKFKARRHLWRISEKTLFLVSIFGGSIGTWAGMYLFMHKTRHWYFVVGMPLILVVHVAVFVYLMQIMQT